MKINTESGTSIIINRDDITFKSLNKGRTKIFIKQLEEHTYGLENNISKLAVLIKKTFIMSCIKYFEKYQNTLGNICKFISELDFLVSGACVASEYFYCKPEIYSDKNIPSFVSSSKLRHAIIERLSKQIGYVPNDVYLGNVPNDKKLNPNIDIFNNDRDKNGMLLFGLNSAGKSSYMKSIGISIILAQIGYYVPAEKFIYEPYMAIYARINGNDNILKGLSSFALEMTELDTILTRINNNGENIMVIGDEVCRGTERFSALSIVSSSLVSLSQSNCTYIFSSHLHELCDITEVMDLTNISLFHLRVEYDLINKCLIFNRKLCIGSGPSVYGLTVAKYLVKDQSFLNRAELIKDRLIGENKINTPVKKSNFNSDLFMRECHICGYRPRSEHDRDLDTHHINFQKDCDSNGKINISKHLTKNMLYNLVVLCKPCHKNVHSGVITIEGYKDTSNGPKLSYNYNIGKDFNNCHMDKNFSKTTLKIKSVTKTKTHKCENK